MSCRNVLSGLRERNHLMRHNAYITNERDSRSPDGRTAGTGRRRSDALLALLALRSRINQDKRAAIGRPHLFNVGQTPNLFVGPSGKYASIRTGRMIIQVPINLAL
jgi:hypothetical protein